MGYLVSGWVGYLVSGWISEWLGGLPSEWLGGWKALSVTVVMDVLYLQTRCRVHLVVCFLPLEPAAHSLLFVASVYCLWLNVVGEIVKTEREGAFQIDVLAVIPRRCS